MKCARCRLILTTLIIVPWIQPAIRLFQEKERTRKGKKGKKIPLSFPSPRFLLFSLATRIACSVPGSLLRSDYWVRPIWVFRQKECNAFYAVYSSSNALNSSIFYDIFNNPISFFQQITSYVGLILPPPGHINISSGLSKARFKRRTFHVPSLMLLLGT